MPTVVLGVTGCIGAYKACEVLRDLQRRDVDVHVVMTKHATEFVSAMTFEALSRHPVFLDQFALGAEGDIRHISLADAAQLLLVAPATANILGKFARGIADDALTTLYLATKAKVVVAPAMNVNMFDHPAVRENLDILRARGVRIVEPGSGYLACGWLGRGRLAEPADIVAAAMAALGEAGSAPEASAAAPSSSAGDLAGETVLVTAGPTVEDLDPVRFLSNRSTGRMGFALAETARDRGARVVLVAGPTSIEPPAGVDVVQVRSAEEMARAVGDRVGPATIVAMAAAVSDYRPAERAPSKLKKTPGEGTLVLTRTPDILATLGKSKGRRFVIGFAAETDRVLENARAKRAAKNADLLVANDVSRPDSGFASDHNAAVLIDAEAETELPLMSKRALADRIWDRVLALRGRPSAKALAKRAARPARRK
ncbi:MAG TPA: bifunctional phosphopantothenoylcysteine decarboxylase/phosphopantothenate--cysteine ligase CoaBC [Vicinamibacteria bacterium]|nr:bifunctional phosphopantothenoylcysteine decarboxylase/phosphopantothenate--cysteine ligase CoaBC [Vicinamibacteria bacterium]